MPVNPDSEDQRPVLSELSHDPSTWLGRKDDAAAEIAKAPAAESPPKARPVASRRSLFIAGGAAGLVTMAGVGVWLTHRPKVASPTGPAKAEHYVFTLADFNGLGPALTAYGISTAASNRIVSVAATAMPRSDGELRVELVLNAGPQPGLASLVLTHPDGSGESVKLVGDDFRSAALASTTRLQVKIARGQMDSQSFYSSAVSAGLNDALIPDFFQAFVYDFDFQREIEPGDVFEAAFEQTVNAQGDAIGPKRLIYASMTTKQKSRALYSFTEQGQKASWFDGAGNSIQRSLMKTPVEGARISSTFGMREHPVLGFTRMHKGTDFATPIGTPVFASGAGKISYMGMKTGYGNYVSIEHTPMLSTAYGHLSAFMPGLGVGSQVAQGQQVALSGNTGVSSGPHVHYEILVNGEQVDSQTYQTEQGYALTGTALVAFKRERDRIDAGRVASL